MRTKKQIANLRPDAAVKHSATSRVARSGELRYGFEHLIPVVARYWED